MDQPDNIQQPTDGLINAPSIFHLVESLIIELQVDLIPLLPIQRSRPIENIKGSPYASIQTWSQSGTINKCLFACFIYQVDHKDNCVDLMENSWVEAV